MQRQNSSLNMIIYKYRYGSRWSCMDVRVGLWRKLSAKELMLLNYGVGGDSWESLGLQGDPKENQSWMFTGRTDAETPILWPPDIRSWLTGKDPDAGKDHQLKGHEFEQILGDGVGQRNLVCCSPWGHKQSDMTEWLNIYLELSWCLWVSFNLLMCYNECILRFEV